MTKKIDDGMRPTVLSVAPLVGGKLLQNGSTLLGWFDCKIGCVGLRECALVMTPTGTVEAWPPKGAHNVSVAAHIFRRLALSAYAMLPGR